MLLQDGNDVGLSEIASLKYDCRRHQVDFNSYKKRILHLFIQKKTLNQNGPSNLHPTGVALGAAADHLEFVYV